MLKEFPILYSRTANGGINVWQIIVSGDSFFVVEGLMNGVLTRSNPVVCQPKNVGRANETTAEEQAFKEAEARYKKKLKSGYVEDVKDVDTQTFISPMLAKNYKDYAAKIDFTRGEWLLQCKLNGVRCVATKNGLFSRTGERYITPVHVEEALKPFFEKYPDAFLDGELFNYEYRQSLNELIKLVRKTVNITNADMELCRKMVKYHIYDGVISDANIPYGERFLGIISDAVKATSVSSETLQIISSYILRSEEEMRDYYQKLIDEGHEGAMLRLVTSPYEFKRSKNLLKLKPEDDSEATILDINEGLGDWAGTGKIITLNWQGKVFNATFKGTIEDGKQFLVDKAEWIGKTVTFQYNGLTGLGVPNYARVDIKNCVKEAV